MSYTGSVRRLADSLALIVILYQFSSVLDQSPLARTQSCTTAQVIDMVTAP